MSNPPAFVGELAVKKERIRLLKLELKSLNQQVTALERKTLEWMYEENQKKKAAAVVPPHVTAAMVAVSTVNQSVQQESATVPPPPNDPAKEITSIPVNTRTEQDIFKYGAPGEFKRVVRVSKESITRARLVNWMSDFFHQQGVKNSEEMAHQAIQFCYDSRKEVRREYKIERKYESRKRPRWYNRGSSSGGGGDAKME